MPSLPTLPLDEPVASEPWEHERAADEACCCAAGKAHAPEDVPCPRGSRCHCARPIGHPVPIAVSHRRDACR